MKLSGRGVLFAVLVAVGYHESGHCQPMTAYYVVPIDARFSLVHSSRDAISIIDRKDNHELLMIDPVWDKMKLDAYCKLPNAILVRAHSVDDEGQPSGGTVSYYVISVPEADVPTEPAESPRKVEIIANGTVSSYVISHSDAASPTKLDGPLSEGEFNAMLRAMPMDSKNLIWIEPSHPDPSGRRLTILLFRTISLVVTMGYILPIPFVLMLAHYSVLKRRLRRLSALQQPRA